MRLSQLNLDPCKQLRKQTRAGSEISPAAQDQILTSVDSNAFGDALNSTEVDVAILQEPGGQITSPAASVSSSSPASTVSETGCRAPVDLVCILNPESCHFRIVNLFNLFQNQLRQIHDSDALSLPLPPPTTPRSPPVLPGLFAAGFLVREAGMQTTVLF
ncbi:hypothetical protein CTRI78_v011477 [Colletotrichum trifolii]|uniref:Uncharacterized protein n=1 Tax=Colletotrichum trifolii TaxID=5466 RepID=A0A4R8QMY2_COLTR|nr:hypothetical protein CTRI78_v011477 [Colletotrichum trifolii]